MGPRNYARIRTESLNVFNVQHILSGSISPFTKSALGILPVSVLTSVAGRFLANPTLSGNDGGGRTI
jgi:hypothetical protein